MAGLGRKVFSPGEVLTATNVQNYLMDQAVQVYAGTASRGSAIGTATTEGMVSYLSDVHSLQMATGTATWVNVDSLPIVAGTAARDALYPSPVLGNTVFRSDLGYSETYYTAYGTANTGGRASAGWYNNERNIGLVPIVPPTVNFSGGTAAANTLGAISFSAVTNISLNNVFSSLYKNYKVLINVTSSSAGSDKVIRFRAAGSEITATNYVQSGYYSTSTNISAIAYALTAGTYYGVAVGGLQNAASEVRIFNPNESVITRMTVSSISDSASTTTYSFNGGGIYKATTEIDGLTFFPVSGNMTGTIQVLGFNS
jgi:hypothetical protein